MKLLEILTLSSDMIRKLYSLLSYHSLPPFLKMSTFEDVNTTSGPCSCLFMINSVILLHQSSMTVYPDVVVVEIFHKKTPRLLHAAGKMINKAGV